MSSEDKERHATGDSTDSVKITVRILMHGKVYKLEYNFLLQTGLIICLVSSLTWVILQDWVHKKYITILNLFLNNSDNNKGF